MLINALWVQKRAELSLTTWKEQISMALKIPFCTLFPVEPATAQHPKRI